MKKNYLLGIIMGLSVAAGVLSVNAPVQAASGDVKINSTNFPDAEFRKILKEEAYDVDQNGVLSAKEIKNITELELYSENGPKITSLKGIEYFTELTYLGCAFHDLSEIDVSKNINLVTLDCFSNNLNEVDVSKNVKLESLSLSFNKLSKLNINKNVNLKLLDCIGNNLNKLDISKNKELLLVWCFENNLSSLDVSKNVKLQYLECYSNKLSSLDVSKNVDLKELYCSTNNISNLDVSKNKNLEELYCGNNKLSKLDVSKNAALWSLNTSGNNLSKLDVSKNTELLYLQCFNDNLSVLDVSKNLKLTGLECSGNNLSQLDVSKNTELKDLYCSENNLGNLNVGKNKNLSNLNCSGNKLSKLDVSKNINLKSLYCSANKLSRLDVSKNTNLSKLACSSNRLAGLSIKGNTLEEFQCENNVCYVSVDSSGQFDLSKLEGFNIKKAGNWEGGTVNGNILTFTDDVVNYRYSTGGYDSNNNKIKVSFSLVRCTHNEETVKKTVKATFKKNGGVKTVCADCGKTIKTNKVYYKMEAPKLSKTTYTYDGELKTPKVTVKDSKGNTLKKDTDYTVSYAKGRREPGKYKVTIKGKGKYSGTVTKTFTIKPPKTAITSISSPKAKTLQLEWKKSSVVSGYQIYVSLSKEFDKNTSKVIVKTNKGSIKSLKSGKKYYVKIRTYKTAGDEKIYSAWSEVKSVKIK